MAAVAVRLAEPDDLASVCEIVNHYIATTVFSFRTSPQTPDEWLDHWREYHWRYPWLVATSGPRVVGVAHAVPWKARGAYDWCAETAVYVAAGAVRCGIGRQLYERLFELLDAQGYHSQIAVIALPNAGSV